MKKIGSICICICLLALSACSNKENISRTELIDNINNKHKMIPVSTEYEPYLNKGDDYILTEVAVKNENNRNRLMT